MTHEIPDDPLEALLREQFDGPVPDEGFSARVMQRIPRRRRKVQPILIGLLFGAAGCFASLLRWPALNLEQWHSASTLALTGAMTALTLLIGWWGIADADDR